MALIGKIQEKKGLMLIMIGVAMLAFIMGGWESIFGSRGANIGLGTVDGEIVSEEDFAYYSNQMKQQDYQQAMQQGRQYTAADEKNSTDKAWGIVTEKMLMSKEMDALGLDVSDAEFDAYLYGRDGFQVMDDLARSFADSITGQFNPRLLEKAIERMEKSTDPQEAENWRVNKKAMKEERKAQKYGQLLKQSVYVTTLEAAEEYNSKNEVKSISYAMYRYSELPDEKIKVTDDEVKAYYNAHKKDKKYEATAGRDIKLFDIMVKPSKNDSLEFTKKLGDIKSKFKNAKNDSLFVIANTDNKMMYNRLAIPNRPDNDPEAKQGSTYPSYMDSVFRSASVGDVVGPYFADGKMMIAKITKFNNLKLSARHILINANRGDSAAVKLAKVKADSIVKLVNKENFAEMVTKFSGDTPSIEKGGEYNDFIEDEFVPEFSQFVIKENVGKIGVVQSDFGFHIIEVLGKTPAKFPVLAKIEKVLTPSRETEMTISDEAYSIISQFDAKIASISNPSDKVKMFDSLAVKHNYYVRPTIQILDNNPSISNISTPFAEDKLIKFAYAKGVEVGTMSSAPIEDNDRYLIAIVTSVRKKGVPNFEDVAEAMKAEVIKDKKAERFTVMMNKGSLEAIAKDTQIARVVKGDLTFNSNRLPEGPHDPIVVGSVFSGIKDGAKTIPIKGQSGVYVIKVEKTIKAPVSNDKYEMEKSQLFAQARGTAESRAKSALMKKYEIKDNRRFASLGIRLDK